MANLNPDLTGYLEQKGDDSMLYVLKETFFLSF